MSDFHKKALIRALDRAMGAADEAWELVREVFEVKQCDSCGCFGGAIWNAYNEIKEASIKIESAKERIRFALEKERQSSVTS